MFAYRERNSLSSGFYVTFKYSMKVNQLNFNVTQGRSERIV